MSKLDDLIDACRTRFFAPTIPTHAIKDFTLSICCEQVVFERVKSVPAALDILKDCANNKFPPPTTDNEDYDDWLDLLRTIIIQVVAAHLMGDSRVHLEERKRRKRR